MINYETLANGTAFNNQEQDINKPIQTEQPKQEDNFLRNSILNVEANTVVNPIVGIGSYIADKVGNQDLKQTLMNESKDYTALSNATTRDYQDITKLKSLGDVGKFAGYQAINLGANIPLLLGPGRIASGIAGGLTESNLIRGAVDKLATGVGAGLQNAGSLNAINIAEKNNVLSDEQNAVAVGSGAILGIAEQGSLLGKLGVTNSRLLNGLISGGFNAGVGVSQDAINRATLGKDLTNEEAINSYINSGAVGGITGFGGGFLGGKTGKLNEERINEQNTQNTTDNNVDSGTPSNYSNIKFSNESDNVNPVVNTELNVISNKKLTDTLEEFKKSINDKTNNNDGIINTSEESLLPPLNFDEYKKSLQESNKDLSPSIIKRLDDITENFKISNEDNTLSISKNYSLLLDKISDIVKNSDENNSSKVKFLNEINKITKDENFDNNSVNKLLEKFKEENIANKPVDENIVNKPIEENIANKPLEEQKVINKPIDENIINKPLEENVINKPIEEQKVINEKVDDINNLKQENTVNKSVDDVITKQKQFRDNINNLTDKEVYGFIDKQKTENPLSVKEDLELKQLENSIKPIKDNLNLDVIVIPEKHSPFGDQANGWFDEKNNRIILVGTKDAKSNIENKLMHEIWHKGISNTVNEKGREFVNTKFEELYKNKVIKEYADNFINSGMERTKSIEEAVGHAIEDGKLTDTKFLQKVFDTLRNIINKLVGKDLKLSNEDVKDFISKTNKTVIDENLINKKVETEKSILMFSRNLEDENLRNARIKFEENDKKTLNSVGNYIADFIGSDAKGLIDKQHRENYKESLNSLNPYGKFMENVATARHLLQKIGGTEIFNIKTRQNSFKGNLEYKYQQLSEKMTDIYKKNKLSKKDLSILERFVADNGYLKNEGKGIRITEDDVKNYLSGKVNTKKFNALNEYYKVLRESADLNIYLSGLKDTVSMTDVVISSLEKTNKDVATQMRETINQVSKNVFNSDNPDVITVKNIQDKLIEILNGNADKFNDDTKILLKPILEGLNQIKEQNKALYERGYIPKDMTGKFVVSVIHKESGTVVAVYPFKKDKTSSSFYAKLKNEVGDSLEVQSYERTQPIDSSFNINKAIKEIEKYTKIDDKQLRDLTQLGLIRNEFERTYKGYGFNENISNVIHDSSYKNISDASRNFGNADINNFINSYPKDSVERNHLVEIYNQMDENLKVSDKPLDKELRNVRSVASLFTLGLNFANTTAQLFQSSFIGVSNATKYGTTGNIKFFEAEKLVRNGYKTNDPMLKQVLDELKNNELIGANMTKQMFEDTKKQHELSAFDKVKQFAYLLNEYAEKTLRMATVLRSVEVYKNALNGKIKNTELANQIKSQNIVDFVANEVAIVNGDFSKINRSKILQGEFAQTILMFQQWKAMTLHSFDNMDAKGKLLFISLNIMGGGVLGIPFAQDAIDTFDFFAKLFGYNIPAKRFINNTIKDVAGDSELANQMLRTGIPGVGERVGTGQLIPQLKGVNELLQGNADMAAKNILGPSYNFISNIAKGVTNLDPVVLSPSIIKNVINGFKAGMNDYTTDDKGNKILTNVGDFEAMLMMIGFSSSEVSNKKNTNNMLMTYRKNLIDIKNSYVEKIKEARNDNNFDKAREILDEARQLGYNIDYVDLIKEQSKNKDQKTKTLNSLSVRDRMKLKQDIKL